MITTSWLQYLFYLMLPLSGVSALCLIIGLLKQEQRTGPEEQVLSGFQMGDENPAIKRRTPQMVEHQNREVPGLSTAQVIDFDTSEVPQESLESPEEWGKRFRKEKQEKETATEAEKREDNRSEILSPPLEEPSPSPPATPDENGKTENEPIDLDKAKTPFRLVNQVLEVKLSKEVSTTTQQGSPIKLSAGQKVKVLVQGVKVDENGNIIKETPTFGLEEDNEEEVDYSGI